MLRRGVGSGLRWALLILGLLGVPAGPAKGDPVWPRADTVQPEHYGLDLRFDFETGQMFGVCTIAFRNTGPDPVRALPLVLYRLLRVSQIRDGSGQELGFEQAVVGLEGWEQFQLNGVRVELNEPVPPGESACIEVSYAGYLLGYTEVGMSYVRDRVDPEFTLIRNDCLSYPLLSAPVSEGGRNESLDRFSYGVRVTVPQNLRVACGGRLVSQQAAGDGQDRYEFESARLGSRIDLAISSYEVIEGEGVRVYCFADDREGGQRVLEQTMRAIGVLGNWFGSLPDTSEFAVIEIPDGWGSQAGPGSLLQTASAFKDEGFARELYHEVSHLWDASSADEFPCRLESEGLAMFLQNLVQESVDGQPGAVEAGVEAARASLIKMMTQRPELRELGLRDSGRVGFAVQLSYLRGQIFFAVLHRAVGHERFVDFVSAYHRDSKAEGSQIAEFERRLVESFGEIGERLDADWIQSGRSNTWLESGESLETLVSRAQGR